MPGKGKSVSETFMRRSGGLSIHKGTYENKYNLSTWDYIDDCSGDDCCISHLCKFDREYNVKCSVQSQYIRRIGDILVKCFAPKVDESVMFRAGIHLLPLYRYLIRMKIQELSLGNPMAMVGKSMDYKVNPIYREIRETIKTIEWLWSKLGLAALVKDEVFPDESFIPGNSNYYEKMEKEALREIKKKRGLKLNLKGMKND